MPTHTSKDIIEAAHNRAFVVSGVRDDALLADFQKAIDDALAEGMPFKGWTDKDGTYREGFRDRFDEIVKKHGWDHSQSADRRARVIFETNLATAHSAGRVAQARSPAVMKQFPFWQYKHAWTRIPSNPRKQHERWDGLVLLATDPFWDTHTPPNGYFCSCGFRLVSKRMLKKMGKTGPDLAPPSATVAIIDSVTNAYVEYPEGIQYGFAYQPGQDWAEGLVPRPLAGKPDTDYRQLTLPTPKPPALPDGKAFKAKLLDEGVSDEVAISKFLSVFGALPDKSRAFRDKSGQTIIASRQLFTRPDGSAKLTPDRKRHLPILAEAIADPDEIWVNWEQNRATGAWYLARYYLRYGSDKTSFAAFRYGQDGWSGVTTFNPTKGKKRLPGTAYLERHRKGRLIYKRGGA